MSHKSTYPGGSFLPRPHFIVLTLTKRTHYKAERETACSVNVLKLVSPNQSDLQQLWGQSTSKPNALGLGLGGISFLKTVNTLQVALQKHKGGVGPSKHEVHLQRCQESPREHMPHNRGISGHRRYPPKAHLDG